jgi:hypothetical protein
MYATCFGLYLGPQACQYKNHTKVTPQLSANKHRSTTTLISILAHNLQTEFKEGFYTRIGYSEAMLCQLQYTKS